MLRVYFQLTGLTCFSFPLNRDLIMYFHVLMVQTNSHAKDTLLKVGLSTKRRRYFAMKYVWYDQPPGTAPSEIHFSRLCANQRGGVGYNGENVCKSFKVYSY